MSESELRIICIAFYGGIITDRELEANLHYYFRQHPSSAKEREAARRSFKQADSQKEGE